MYQNIEDERRIDKFVRIVKERLSDKSLLLILSFLVGIFTAFAALILKKMISLIEHGLTGQFDAHMSNMLYLVYPVVGIYITGVFIRRIVRDDIGHGVTKILFAISRNQGRIKAHNTWSSVIASAITIGFGGSVGAESPIVLTGSAIGSNLGRLFRLEHKTMMLLIGCGAAGAVAGIFKAPIAGFVFTLEVLMLDLTMASLLPLLVTSVTAATITYAFSDAHAMFEFHLDQAFAVERVPAYILLGVISGFVSLYFTRSTNKFEGVFGRLKNPYVKLMLGGSVLSILIYLFPPLFGEGYSTIELLLNGKNVDEWNTVMNNSWFYGNGKLLLVYLLLVVLTKSFATTATNGGGGCGGIFAPSLFLGCISGFGFSHLWNINNIGVNLPEKNFALLGMSGLMSGVMHAPLTGIFLIAELTGGYALFIPLMIVSVCAYLTIMAFEPHSVYAMRLAKKGQLLTHHKDHSILTLLTLDSVIEKDVETLEPSMDLSDIVHAISHVKRDVFPVVDKGNKLLGIIWLDDLREIMFRQELYHRFKVVDLMQQPNGKVFVNDQMTKIMQVFDTNSLFILPVVDENNVFVGFISKEKAYSAYRQTLVDFSEE